MDNVVAAPGLNLSQANGDLMEPILETMRASSKDAPTKVGVLIDAAAAILATLPAMQSPAELRATSGEMRKRLIKVTRLHQAAFETRQKNATATLNEFGEAARKQGLTLVKNT